jgi:F-type H+-transporting ATPase subunit gamma
MANLRDIRRRIKSIKNTAQITKAMQMVAASRMRKAQLSAIAGRPYATQLDEIAYHLHNSGSDFTHPLIHERPVKKACALVITTDKGLCGALNTNLLREVLKQDPEGKKAYITAGRRGKQFLARLGRELLADFEIKDNFTFRDSKRISAFLIERYIKEEFDTVEIYFTRFINTINQKPERSDLMPIGVHKFGFKDSEEVVPGDYLFEPDAPHLLSKLLPFYVHFEVYQALLDAKASEHSARMVAMKNATDNANELVKDLTLEYNKARQSMITTELLEISSAAAALG